MQLLPHLVVDDGLKAIEFYKAAFGAEAGTVHMAPDGVKVFHAELKLGDSLFMLCDGFEMSYSKSPMTLGGTPVTLSLSVEDADAAASRAIEAGATAIMPVQDTFWGARYGQVQDPFGHVWAFNQQVRQVGAAEIDAHFAGA